MSKPTKATWRSWTIWEGETEFVFVSLSAGDRRVQVSRRVTGDICLAILDLMGEVNQTARALGWIGNAA